MRSWRGRDGDPYSGLPCPGWALFISHRHRHYWQGWASVLLATTLSMTTQKHHIHWFFFSLKQHKQKLAESHFKYLFVCALSWLCHMGSLNWGTWGLAPWPGIERVPPALGARSLSHWTTWESQSWFFSHPYSGYCRSEVADTQLPRSTIFCCHLKTWKVPHLT